MKKITNWVKTVLASITFYTIIPIPSSWELNFKGIARYASYVGLLLGLILALTDFSLELIGFPIVIRSALLVGLWVMLTGGLHLDGVMDTADGLAIFNNPQKRLEVMRDSLTGAFGVMAGCFVILLKIIALSEIPHNRSLILMASAGWARWGQVVAISCYPYLRLEGKGAFHKENSQPLWDLVISLCFYLIFSVIIFIIAPEKLILILQMLGFGVTISLLTGYWFNYQLGGQTGDSYGAIVEWAETFFLCLLTIVQ